jgi:hypothetical protein
MQRKGEKAYCEESLSTRKHIITPNRVTDLVEFQMDTVCRTFFEYFDKGKFCTVRKVAFTLEERSLYEGPVFYFVYVFL